MGHAPTAVRPAFNLNLKRLTRNDQIVGGATLVLFISLFLPWFTVSVRGFGSGSVNGLYHGYMYIDLILALAILAFLVLRAGFDELPFRLPVGSEQELDVTAVNAADRARIGPRNIRRRVLSLPSARLTLE